MSAAQNRRRAAERAADVEKNAPPIEFSDPSDWLRFVARADQQHGWVLAGDDRGIYSATRQDTGAVG